MFEKIHQAFPQIYAKMIEMEKLPKNCTWSDVRKKG